VSAIKLCVVTENRSPFDIVWLRFEVNDISNGSRIFDMNMLLIRAAEDRFGGLVQLVHKR